jgi:hypothetical protein
MARLFGMGFYNLIPGNPSIFGNGQFEQKKLQSAAIFRIARYRKVLAIGVKNMKLLYEKNYDSMLKNCTTSIFRTLICF